MDELVARSERRCRLTWRVAILTVRLAFGRRLLESGLFADFCFDFGPAMNCIRQQHRGQSAHGSKQNQVFAV